MPLLLLASISLFFYPSLVYGRGGLVLSFSPQLFFHNPGCIVRVGAQVRQHYWNYPGLCCLCTGGNEASRFPAVDGPALRRADLRNAGEKGEMGLEFWCLVDGASFIFSWRASEMLGMRLLVGIGGQRDGMEMVYECFARHMASSS